MKICKRCEIEKPLDCFYKAHVKNKSGTIEYYRGVCKECDKIYSRIQYGKKFKHKQKKISEEERLRRRREYDNEWKKKKREEIRRGITPWWVNIYNYVVSTGYFTEDDLPIIKKWLMMVDKLGGRIPDEKKEDE